MNSSWADAEDQLPPTEVIENPDGTKTVISYKYDEKRRKIKVTQKIKLVKVTEDVNPAIAARKKWARFGEEKDNATPGPDARTTQFGETVRLLLSTSTKDEDESEKKEVKKETKGKAQRLTCRTCGGNHFTSKCPFKDTLGGDLKKKEEAAEAAAAANAGPTPGTFASRLAAGRSSYVPPNKRAGGSVSRFASSSNQPEETTTLRVTNLNQMVDEGTLNMLFSRFGHIRRLTILRDRETRESKGIAFVEMGTISEARRGIEGVNGKGLMNLIVSVDFAKPRGER